MKRLNITGVDKSVILERIGFLTKAIQDNPMSPQTTHCDLELADLQDSMSRSAPMPKRPEGAVQVIREISSECDTSGAFFSFEKSVREVALVQHQERQYIRLIEYSCTAEANTRPCSVLDETYYLVFRPDAERLAPDNWTTLVIKPPVYHYWSSSNDVLY